MLTPVEKVLFAIAVLVSLWRAWISFGRMAGVVRRGQGQLHFDLLGRRLLAGLGALVGQGGMIKRRPTAFFFHCLIAWGFIYYGLVNIVDVLEGYLPGFRFLEGSALGSSYRLLADVLSIAVLVGIGFFLIRRFVARTPALSYNGPIKLHPDALPGISRDSFVVGAFIVGHVGFRFLGASFSVAIEGGDVWQPFANQVAALWESELFARFGRHISWWVSLGLVLVFVPYFPHSKHAHLFMGPLNWITRPERRSLGALDAIDFEDTDIEQFGSARLTDLSQTQIVDAFACIMCNRCQDVCPAYITGKTLSPAALEINKRAYLRENMKSLSQGGEDGPALLEYAIDEDAVWACLSCGACVEVCPVGNEPMFDILAIRQDQVLMHSRFPSELRGAFTGLERQANPWQMAEDRLGWTQSLNFSVPTVEENPDFEVLYWVGCAGAFDPGAQQTARAIATVLHGAGVNFAVLGNNETCTGDLARRSGNEYLFSELARANIEALKAVGADQKVIVTGCPHCMHTLGNEYPAFGASFRVLHHTQFMGELIESGGLKLKGELMEKATFHDPCYLGRNTGEYSAPREVLDEAGLTRVEMGRHKSNSFCCGGGGAQMWKEEEKGTQAVNANRYAEARATGAEILAVGCPFCARMLKDANAQAGSEMAVKDVAEVVAEAM